MGRWRQFKLEVKFFALLKQWDQRVAEQWRRLGCPVCGGRLHSASYPRQPRGVPTAARGWMSRRFSFCCSREGCRKRVTPPSVRFLGRKVYAAAVVVVASVSGLVKAAYAAADVAVAGAVMAVRTVWRWLGWWRHELPRTGCWRALRGRFSGDGPLPSRLPDSLMQVLEAEADTSSDPGTDGTAEEQLLLRVLALLAPVTAYGAAALRGVADPQSLSVSAGSVSR